MVSLLYTDENVEDRPHSLALRPGVQKRISPYQTSGRSGLALAWQYKSTRAPKYCTTGWAVAVQKYQRTRVLQYCIGTASIRVPEH